MSDRTKTCGGKDGCGQELPLSSFYDHKGGKYGKGTLCKECNVEKQRRYRKDNPEKNKEYCKAYKQARPGENYARVKEWRKANPEKRSAQNKRHYERHPELYVAKVARRKAAKLHRTPSWSDLASIDYFYSRRPEGYHVDHIIPLQGKNVSGLHVLSNLQYLPARENRSKNNQF